MTEFLGESRRTDYCAELGEKDIGKRVCVMGWVQRQRDLGSLIFIDLRDRSGIIQLAFDDESDREVFAKAFAARSEYVLCAEGEIRERSSKNPAIPTGSIEVFVTALKILAVSETPPFEIVESSTANEELRLKYRYLDLRRPDLQRKILLRDRIVKSARQYFGENGFIDIETPMLIRSTPEGARDYLVPSRVHKGSFYALPQSPQMYKQLCMVAGFDRYVQFARCFRDEDLRADRQPEFTQIDIEMSFVGMEDIISMVEGLMNRITSELFGKKEEAFARYSYTEVMERYGSDRPDIRFGMEITDISDCVMDSEFVVFSSALAGGGTVRGIKVEGRAEEMTRKILDRLTEYAKGCGAKGVAWIKNTGEVTSSFSKFMKEEEMTAIIDKMGMKEGDVCLIIADTNKQNVLTQLGQLRVQTADMLGIERKGLSFLWVVDMPYFEYDSEKGIYNAMHHPFTAPSVSTMQYLKTDKDKVTAQAYDLVLNGVELLSGSIRITDPSLQAEIFDLLGLTDEEIKEKFGFLVEAFRYGAPPHGGAGIGLDRLVMQLLEAGSLREVVAFPKVQNASEPMTDSPASVPPEALSDLGISIKK